MNWGEDKVFYDTYSRLLSQKESIELLPKYQDLDTLEDLKKILQESPTLIDSDLVNQILNLN